MDNRKRARPLTPYGRWVKTQTVAQGISLDELAAKVGITKQYLSSVIHGARSGKKYVKLIAHELGGDLKELKDVI